jgi:hypothetical protein
MGMQYQSQLLKPFGLNDVYSNNEEKAVQSIREIWRVRCLIYLDDLLILHQGPNQLKEITPQITQFLQHLG